MRGRLSPLDRAPPRPNGRRDGDDPTRRRRHRHRTPTALVAGLLARSKASLSTVLSIILRSNDADAPPCICNDIFCGSLDRQDFFICPSKKPRHRQPSAPSPTNLLSALCPTCLFAGISGRRWEEIRTDQGSARRD